MSDHEPIEGHGNTISVRNEEEVENLVVNDDDQPSIHSYESENYDEDDDFGLLALDEEENDIENVMRSMYSMRHLEVQNFEDEDVHFVRAANGETPTTFTRLNSLLRQVANRERETIVPANTQSNESLFFIRPVKLQCNSLSFSLTPGGLKRYYCKIMMNNEVFKSQALSGKDNAITSKSSSSVTTTGIFDILEYYGPTNVSIQILEQSLPGLPNSMVAIKNVPFHTFINPHNSSSSSSNNDSLDPRIVAGNMVPHSVTLYLPRIHTKTCLSVLHPTSASSSNSDKSGFYLTLNFYLLPLHRCMQLNAMSSSSSSASALSRDLMPNSETLQTPLRYSDLHLAAAYGSKEVLGRILHSLTRNGNIRRAMSVRDSQKRTPLEVALICGNETTTRVLLTHAGHLCFQQQSDGPNNPVENQRNCYILSS